MLGDDSRECERVFGAGSLTALGDLEELENVASSSSSRSVGARDAHVGFAFAPMAASSRDMPAGSVSGSLALG